MTYDNANGLPHIWTELLGKNNISKLHMASNSKEDSPKEIRKL